MRIERVEDPPIGIIHLCSACRTALLDPKGSGLISYGSTHERHCLGCCVEWEKQMALTADFAGAGMGLTLMHFRAWQAQRARLAA